MLRMDRIFGNESAPTVKVDDHEHKIIRATISERIIRSRDRPGSIRMKTNIDVCIKYMSIDKHIFINSICNSSQILRRTWLRVLQPAGVMSMQTGASDIWRPLKLLARSFLFRRSGYFCLSLGYFQDLSRKTRKNVEGLNVYLLGALQKSMYHLDIS